MSIEISTVELQIKVGKLVKIFNMSMEMLQSMYDLILISYLFSYIIYYQYINLSEKKACIVYIVNVHENSIQ